MSQFVANMQLTEVCKCILGQHFLCVCSLIFILCLSAWERVLDFAMLSFVWPFLIMWLPIAGDVSVQHNDIYDFFLTHKDRKVQSLFGTDERILEKFKHPLQIVCILSRIENLWTGKAVNNLCLAGAVPAVLLVAIDRDIKKGRIGQKCDSDNSSSSRLLLVWAKKWGIEGERKIQHGFPCFSFIEVDYGLQMTLTALIVLEKLSSVHKTISVGVLQPEMWPALL